MAPADPRQVEARRHVRPSLYERWAASWEAALAALRNASLTGALSTDETARHRSAIATERDLVIEQLTLLVGHGAPEAAIAYSGARPPVRVDREA